MRPDALLSRRDELEVFASLITDAQRSAALAAGARRRLLDLDRDESPTVGGIFEARDLRRSLPLLEKSESDAREAIDLFHRATTGAWPGVRPATEVIA